MIDGDLLGRQVPASGAVGFDDDDVLGDFIGLRLWNSTRVAWLIEPDPLDHLARVLDVAGAAGNCLRVQGSDGLPVDVVERRSAVDLQSYAGPLGVGPVETAVAERRRERRQVCRQNGNVDFVSHAADGTSALDAAKRGPRTARFVHTR